MNLKRYLAFLLVVTITFSIFPPAGRIEAGTKATEIYYVVEETLSNEPNQDVDKAFGDMVDHKVREIHKLKMQKRSLLHSINEALSLEDPLASLAVLADADGSLLPHYGESLRRYISIKLRKMASIEISDSRSKDRQKDTFFPSESGATNTELTEGGSGTKYDPYVISTAVQLDAVRCRCLNYLSAFFQTSLSPGIRVHSNLI
jgi:hypothetical protein